jgi:hypothetical protein
VISLLALDAQRSQFLPGFSSGGAPLDASDQQGAGVYGAMLVGRENPASGAAQFEPFVRLLLLLGRDQGLARIAALPDAGFSDELRPATAALFRHGFLKRKNPRLLG